MIIDSSIIRDRRQNVFDEGLDRMAVPCGDLTHFVL